MLRRISMVLALMLAGASASARAQLDDERPGQARGGYAWGAPAAQPDDPLRVMAYAGAGIGLRLLANLDPPFNHEFLAPAYVELGGLVVLPGGELRHGFGLNVATGVTQDVNSAGIQPLEQWSLTPSYHLVVPLRRLVPDLQYDWLTLMGRFGIPVTLGAALEGDGVDVSVGAELGGMLLFKFLAGLGLYVEVQVGVYGGSVNTVHPILAIDGGLLWDYEVLQ
ncbi:MAG TPA: hypothetical protein VIL20_15020 [Sandaracinaceae bacterium]